MSTIDIQDIDNIELVYLSIDDYEELKHAMIETYASMNESYWREHQIKALIDKFPEGQVVVKINNGIAGCALSIIVDYAQYEGRYTYSQITGNYTFDTHNPDGTKLYGIDVLIRPK